MSSHISKAIPSPSSQPKLKSRVIVIQQPDIDETNEEVQELLEAEMGTVEECIRAIEVHKTAKIAYHHMMELKEKEALLQDIHLPVIPGSRVMPEVSEPGLAGFVRKIFLEFILCKLCFRTGDIVISVKKVDDKYLRLEELGNVLNQLSLTFPGTSSLTLFVNVAYGVCLYFQQLLTRGR